MHGMMKKFFFIFFIFIFKNFFMRRIKKFLKIKSGDIRAAPQGRLASGVPPPLGVFGVARRRSRARAGSWEREEEAR